MDPGKKQRREEGVWRNKGVYVHTRLHCLVHLREGPPGTGRGLRGGRGGAPGPAALTMCSMQMLISPSL